MENGNGRRPEMQDETVESKAVVRHQLARADIESVVKAALEGRIPRSRPLKSWEPLRLNEVHIQMIFMRAQGVRQNVIAQILGVTDANVSIVLNHPDSLYLLSRLAGHTAGDVIDLNTRLKQLAPEMLELLVDAAYEAPSAKDRAYIAFGLFDRAGYGIKKQVEHKHEIHVPEHRANLLISALEESRSIEDAQFVEITTAEDEDSDEQSDQGE